MKIFVKKKRLKVINGNGEIVEMDALVGEDDAGTKYIRNRSDEQVMRIDITQSRSYPNLKRMRAFLNTTFDMQDLYYDIEIYRNWITVASGWFSIMNYPDGRTELIPKSWAFDNMPEDEFRRMFTAAIGAFLEEFGNGLTEAELMRVIDYD